MDKCPCFDDLDLLHFFRLFYSVFVNDFDPGIMKKIDILIPVSALSRLFLLNRENTLRCFFCFIPQGRYGILWIYEIDTVE